MVPVPPVTKTCMGTPRISDETLSRQRSTVTRPCPVTRLADRGALGAEPEAAAGARRDRPVRRAGLRRHDRRPDRRAGGADQGHVLPALPATSARCSSPGRTPTARLLAEGVAAAPPGATPHRARRRGARRGDRELRPRAARVRAAAPRGRGLPRRAASSETRSSGPASPRRWARRCASAGSPTPPAGLAADLGVEAFHRAFARWSDAPDGASYPALARAELESCTRPPSRCGVPRGPDDPPAIHDLEWSASAPWPPATRPPRRSAMFTVPTVDLAPYVDPGRISTARRPRPAGAPRTPSTTRAARSGSCR